MNPQPDKLFRHKLEGFHKPAPATAWEKIAATQHRKTTRGLWLKIAASVLLMAIATYLLWPGSNTDQKPVKLSEATTVEPASTPYLPQPSDSIVRSEEMDKPVVKSSKSNTPAIKVETPQAAIQKEITSIFTDSIKTTSPGSMEGIPLASVESNLVEPAFVPPAENITLIFSAKEVNEYLSKELHGEATDKTKKSSTWKKLLKRANNLTNNQDPFGELRQKKNEILALNFKNEKQRGQNK
jgi:hypothetical protein